ncbi:MAG: efflux RND transporter periplasmic adaptor subunit [Xanthomonadaceae bacterium]|nr:efflux RND transporter periplasmic adaptor subunit [Xanthomonadaceae bacterium]
MLNRLFATGLLVLVLPVAAQQPAPVAIALPEQAAGMQRVELTGSFTARRAAQVSPRLSGLIAEVAVDAGDAVEAGDVLVLLDDELARLALAQAEASVEQACAARDEAARLRDEGQRLIRDRFLPETELRARESALQVAEASLRVAEAERDTVTERLERHAITAPFAGVIARRLTEAGEWVETATAVVELVAVDALWLDVQVPQRLWPRLRAGAGVTVTVDALPGQTLPARIHARVPVSDPNARTFLLRLALDSEDADITSGMSARVRLEIAVGETQLMIPRDAVIRYPDGTTTVWVVDRETSPARARQVEIVVARTEGDEAVVAAGLEAGWPVVVRGNEVLVADQPVQVVE